MLFPKHYLPVAFYLHRVRVAWLLSLTGMSYIWVVLSLDLDQPSYVVQVGLRLLGFSPSVSASASRIVRMRDMYHHALVLPVFLFVFIKDILRDILAVDFLLLF